MVVFNAQKLGDLEAYGCGAGSVEKNLGRFVHFCHHLLSIDENASVVY